MRSHIVVLLGTLLLFPALCVAQAPAPITGVTIEVSFGFFAGEKLLPPGTYRCAAGDLDSELKITNVKSQESVKMQILTRQGTRPHAEVLFDRAGKEYRLYAVYMPGQPGFLFSSAPGKHAQVRIRGKE
jgi:hypothetical protein